MGFRSRLLSDGWNGGDAYYARRPSRAARRSLCARANYQRPGRPQGLNPGAAYYKDGGSAQLTVVLSGYQGPACARPHVIVDSPSFYLYPRCALGQMFLTFRVP